MTAQIEITVPHGHQTDPTCPHCFEPLGSFLRSAYPETEPERIGGEHHCPSCDGPLFISVYRPEPTFHVHVPAPWGDGVRHIRSSGR